MLPDSSPRIQSNQPLNFFREGLYLAQSDTTKASGVAFRVQSGTYPKYSRIEDLAGPLVYVTTTEEFNELKAANGEKVKFDKVILDITRDKERAKDFMRSYYQRVELANKYFTSYKEGWKTDRGMVYIIFGAPDNVTLGNETEIWFYKSSRTRFIFLKRGSIYDPEYYVLQRSRSYSELWYNTVDFWRKSRF
jgi:GWxTD domain-containing protein